MRVCHFVADRGLGRGEFYVDLANAMANDAEVSLLVPAGARYLGRIDPRIQVVEYRAGNSRRNPLLRWELARKLRALRPELIHTHFAKATELYAAIARRVGIPFVATKHNPRKGRIFERVEHVIAVSEKVRESIAGGRVKVIYNGVACAPVGDAAEPPLDGPFNLLAVGRLDPIKGFDRLLRQVAGLAFDFHLTLVGEGPQRAELEGLIDALGLAGRVTLAGYREDIPERLRAAHLTVISSLSEGGPVIGLEALCHGHLLLSTPVGVMAEILPPELLAEHEALAQRIAAIHADYPRHRALFERLRAEQGPRFRIETVARQHLDHYAGILRAAPAPGGRRGVLMVQPLPGIGDMLWHLPHLHRLAELEPEGRLSVLTKPRTLADQLLAGDPAVAEVLWLERNPGRHDGLRGFFRLVADLRRRRLRKIWIFHTSWRYALAARLAGIPERIGYGSAKQRPFLNGPHTLPGEKLKAHSVEKADRLVALYTAPPTPEMARIVVDDASRRAMEARFGGLPKPWYAFGIGTSEPEKQWGAERFARLARVLFQCLGGTVFLCGGPAEEGVAAEIVERTGEPARVIPALGLPLLQLAALLDESALYCGNDTGVLNMAAAQGIEAVGLFGATRPLVHSPHIHPLVPPEGERGMAAITVDTVAREVERLLDHPPRSVEGG